MPRLRTGNQRNVGEDKVCPPLKRHLVWRFFRELLEDRAPIPLILGSSLRFHDSWGDNVRNPASSTVCLFLFASLVTLSCVAGDSSSNNSSKPVNRGLSIPYPTDVLTYHYSPSRQGSTPQETTLTPSNVNSTSFGKVGFYAVDGKVDAQPLTSTSNSSTAA